MISIVEFLVNNNAKKDIKVDLHVEINSFNQLFELLSKYFENKLIKEPKLHIYDPNKDGLGKVIKINNKDGMYVHNWFELNFDEKHKFIIGDSGDSIYFQYKFKNGSKWLCYSPTIVKTKLKIGMIFDEWINSLPHQWAHGEIEIKRRFGMENKKQ